MEKSSFNNKEINEKKIDLNESSQALSNTIKVDSYHSSVNQPKKKQLRYSMDDYSLTKPSRKTDYNSLFRFNDDTYYNFEHKALRKNSKEHNIFSLFKNANPFNYFFKKKRTEDNSFSLFGFSISILSLFYETKTLAPPIIIGLIKLELLNQKTKKSILIEVKYGPIKWVIFKKESDFLKLHTILVYTCQNKVNLPHYPLHIKKTIMKIVNDNDKVEKINDEIKSDFYIYLKTVIDVVPLNLSKHLLEFLEISSLTFQLGALVKAKEGFLKVMVSDNSFCGLANEWKYYWVILGASYVSIFNSVCDHVPEYVFLFNSRLSLYIHSFKSLDPLKEQRITLNNTNDKLSIKGDVNDKFKYWINSIDEAIKNSEYTRTNRFDSFSPVRENQYTKFYIDGSDYFNDVAQAILNAKEMIYISGWWLSPELYLKRPSSDNKQFRLDRLLKQKASEGVSIYVIIYKEVTSALNINSQHTKESLKKLHKNIHVQRHPDHVINATVFWAHHDKLVVIDNRLSFVGGLDLCFGRFDNNDHKLVDCSPKDPSKLIWVGQDYSNTRIKDFDFVNQHKLELIDRYKFPRLAWHDVALAFTGCAALDVSRHFIQKWNWIKSVKSEKDDSIKLLIPIPTKNNNITFSQTLSNQYGLSLDYDCSVQVLRSSSKWSAGVDKEASIQNAYIEIISKAEYFIYIENQFFISDPSENPDHPIKNKIAKAIVDRIYRAFKESKKFKVIVIMPLIPAFESEINANSAVTIRLIMNWQYCTISRGSDSIIGQLLSKGIPNPKEYISFNGLRTYDVMPDDEKTCLSDSNTFTNSTQPSILDANFAIGTEGQLSKKKIQTPTTNELSSGFENENDISKKRPLRSKCEYFPLSTNNSSSSLVGTNIAPVSNSLKQELINSSIQDNGNLTMTKVLNQQVPVINEQVSIKSKHQPIYVTEQIYVHSKLMIVDDRTVICGSANINDRSMIGFRDSEIASIIEDVEFIDGKFDGQCYKVGKFAHNFRTKLFKEHLGLMENSKLNSENCFDEWKRYLQDPLSPEFDRLWNELSTNNTKAYRRVFKCIPDDTITTWKEFKKFIPDPLNVLPGHVNLDDPTLSFDEIELNLKSINGFLVDFPENFLKNEDLSAMTLATESFLPLSLFT